MKLITVLLLMFLAFTAKSQTPNNFVFRNIYERTHGVYPDSVLHIPTGCGFPSLLTTRSWKGGSALYTDTCNRKLYYYVDTAWYYIPDSAFVMANGGGGVDTIYSRNDSLFYEKDAIEYFVDELGDLLTLMVNGKGSGKQIFYVNNDSLNLKDIGDGNYTTARTLNDSTNVIDVDIDEIRDSIGSSSGGLPYSGATGNGIDSAWIDTTINRIAYLVPGNSFIYHVAITDSISVFDADALAFFSAASITDATQKSAINQLVLDLKAADLWDDMIGLYPYVGGTSSSHAVNLKSPGTYNITWSGSLTHNANGVTGDGASGYGDTDINDNTHLTLNGVTAGAYSRTNDNAGFALGAYGDGISNPALYMADRNSQIVRLHDESDFSQTQTPTRLMVMTRTASNLIRTYRDGSPLSAASGVASTGKSTYDVFLLAFNNNGSAAGFSSKNYALHFIYNAGMTSGQVTDLTNAVNAFETTLGRAL